MVKGTSRQASTSWKRSGKRNRSSGSNLLAEYQAALRNGNKAQARALQKLLALEKKRRDKGMT
ncbi:MAG: hypothetical protein ABIH20_04075 [Candidatus Diapherotrites archaeon]